MGHAASLLGRTMLVHGGRESPERPLADLWALDLDPKPYIGPAHQQPLGSFQGTGAESMPQEMGADRADALRWRPVLAGEGTLPDARHRHSAVAVGGSIKACPL
jgi:hypothetical protein